MPSQFYFDSFFSLAKRPEGAFLIVQCRAQHCCRSEQAVDKTGRPKVCHCEEAEADVAISCRQYDFADSFPNNPAGTARLPGAKRSRNDNSGGVTPQNPCATCCWPAWRSLSAAYGRNWCTPFFNSSLYRLQVLFPRLPRAQSALARQVDSFSILTVAGGTNRLCQPGPAVRSLQRTTGNFRLPQALQYSARNVAFSPNMLKYYDNS